MAIIPARLASSRLPRKALVDIEGLPMIVHVFKRAELCESLDKVYVATCDKEIFDVVESYGGKAMMTSGNEKNGTEGVAEIAEKIEADIVINIQGDEPLVNPEDIKKVIHELVENSDLTCANLVCLTEMKHNPAECKVVFDRKRDILYVSRADIPAFRSHGPIPLERREQTKMYKFCGVVGFPKDFLLKYSKMKQTPLEIAESYEYLRIIENGYKYRAVLTEDYTTSIDVPADLDLVKELMQRDKIKYLYMK